MKRTFPLSNSWNVWGWRAGSNHKFCLGPISTFSELGGTHVWSQEFRIGLVLANLKLVFVFFGAAEGSFYC